MGWRQRLGKCVHESNFWVSVSICRFRLGMNASVFWRIDKRGGGLSDASRYWAELGDQGSRPN